MRILLVTAGSHGDVNPFISIGRALSERGHAVQLLVNPYYQHQVREAGVGFEPCGEYVDLKRVGELYPDIMHPRKGAGVVVQAMVVPTSREAFRRVHQIADTARPDAIVTHFVCPGAAWAAAQRGIPCASIVLAPINWVSRCEPLVGTGWMPATPPRWVARMLRALMLPIMQLTFDPPLRRLRAELGLPWQKRPLMAVMRGGDMNLGMWSPHLRGPLPDDPPHSAICGFPWHDQHGEVEAPPADVQRFLDDGEPPALFCLGTAAVHVAGDFYEQAAEACRMIGRRGLMLVGPGREQTRAWPKGVRAFAYAPFSTVMPRCAVNVHHGGVGSTGQAMRAGRPTVIVPHAHDQWDNAARALRLGVSRTLPRPRVTAARLANAIAAVADDPATLARAAELGRCMAMEDGARAAAEHIERLAHARRA